MKRHLNESNQNHHTLPLLLLIEDKNYSTHTYERAQMAVCMIDVFRQYFSTWNNCYWTGIITVIGTFWWLPFISNAPNRIESHQIDVLEIWCIYLNKWTQNNSQNKNYFVFFFQQNISMNRFRWMVLIAHLSWKYTL